mmetsp:Transcript_151554/g.368053  ORF Transcript_151554/g.368053 Transcript_151554/m.368053 type:complete len:212 (-) Transcript_151554:912-1547(-)
MRSMSSSDSPPLDWITMFCSLPVALSLALTFTIPLASMSKATSTCGTPRGAGGSPTRLNCPRSLLSAAISRSPWSTLISTCDWLSAAVENTCDFLVGIVVLRAMRRVKIPPRVSMPSDSGVTSSNRMSFTSPFSTPPCSPAPMATTSSGLTPFEGALPKKSSTTSCTLGMRVMPPTRSTSSMSALASPESLTHCLHGSSVRCTRLSTSVSN